LRTEFPEKDGWQVALTGVVGQEVQKKLVIFYNSFFCQQ